jgi:16S rRNA processing protein RimM
MKAFVTVGKIVGAHGLMGNIKVITSAESASVFRPGNRIFIKKGDDPERGYEIRSVKPHARFLLLTLAGVDSRNLAEFLIGFELFIEREMLPEPEEGSYYWSDIIGLHVYTVEDEHLGTVESIIETGSNDVYVVTSPDKNELLIPALESVIVDVDLDKKSMRVDLPAGLR